MHEYGLCEAIAETARRRAGGRRVARVTVQIGALLEADPASMEMAFALVTAGTELGGSKLDLVEVPAEGRCRSCGAVFGPRRRSELCPGCGSGNVAVRNGNGVILEGLEYRPEAEHAV